MTTFYVATLARYVLVTAADESAARDVGLIALKDLHAELSEQLGREVPINIRTVRPATADEVELWGWHQELMAAERQARHSRVKGQRATT